MLKKFSRFFKVIIFSIIVILILIQLNNIFMRKSIYKPWDMANKIGGFYNSNDNYALYFLGTSHSYCSFNPLLIYENIGLKSYVLGTEKQPLDVTYYYLKDAIKKDTPGTVFIDIFSAIMLNAEDESVVHAYSNYMPMSLNKLEMIINTVPYGLKSQALLPLIKYHSRWSELKYSDFSLKYSDYHDYLRGYVLLKGHSKNFKKNIDTVVNSNDAKNALKNKAFNDNLKTIKKIQDYATQKDIKVVFVKTPMYYYENYKEGIDRFSDFAKKENIDFVDFNDFKTEMKLTKEDYYDGYHLNVDGAAKFNKFFVKYLVEKGIYTDISNLDKNWKNDLKTYYINR